MDPSLFLLYVSAVLVLTASPGPSVLLCVSTSITQGLSGALVAAAGSLVAILMIMTLSFMGLGVVIASSDLMFSIIKYCGAAYLIVLGVQALLSKQHSFDAGSETAVSAGVLLSTTSRASAH